MTTILCYGDSNTYGYNPVNGLRYPKDVRWTGVLQKLLGEQYAVIEEGCNGRTTVFEDIAEPWKAGLGYLKPCLNTHKPIDFVIMMLGSNDLKRMFHASAKEIADGAEQLVSIIKEFTKEKQGFMPKVILVSPPEIGADIATSEFARHTRRQWCVYRHKFKIHLMRMQLNVQRSFQFSTRKSLKNMIVFSLMRQK